VKQKFFMFLLLMVCVFSCYSIAYGEDESVSPSQTIFGNIKLPDGRVAPEGGLKVNVIAENSTCKKSVECTIREGESVAAYSLKVDYPYYGYELRCELVTPVEGYYAISYYVGDAKKTYMEDPLMKPMKTSASETKSHDITLVKGIKVTGKVVLPDAMTVMCDSSIDVTFSALGELINMADGDPTRFHYFSKSANLVIKAGESYGTFLF
jgi:hypothetical protein